MQIPKPQRDHKGIAGALAISVFAIITLIDTTNMADADSYIFPRAIGLIILCLSTIFIFLQCIRPNNDTQNDESPTVACEKQNLWRRYILILSMLLGTLLMPYIGFLPSGIIIFISIMVVSMYDTWTRKNIMWFSGIGIVIVVSFYLLFAKVLLVPLPHGMFFE